MAVTGAFILETFVKWLVPFICLAIVGLITAYLVNPYKKGRAAISKEEWEAAARSSNIHHEIFDQYTASFRREMEQRDQQLSNQLIAVANKLDTLTDNSIQERSELAANIELVKEGVLDAHLTNLIYTCEALIRKGYVTPSELDHYKQRLYLYHKLGGNGHMDYWDAQINKLPHRDQINNDVYNENEKQGDS